MVLSPSVVSRLAPTAATTAITAIVMVTCEMRGLFSWAACSACSACSCASISSSGESDTVLVLACARRRVEGGLGRRQPGDRHAVGRAADIVEADAVAEGDRGGIATVLAADAQLHPRPRRPTALGAKAHQRPDAVRVDRDEGVLLEDALVDIGVEE